MNSSSNATGTVHPLVLWAQRKDKVLLTVTVENVKEPEIKVTETSLYFKGRDAVGGQTYEVTLEFFKEINVEECYNQQTARNISFTLKKKAKEEPYWPRLLKDSKKVHYVKTDFNKWKDEDESEGEEDEQFNLDEMMQSMGGLQGAGGPGFGAGDAEEEDSDDEDLPDLAQ